MAKRGSADSNGTDGGLVVICNAIANRSVPIVFILVSSLIIANISCDQVGSANELDLAPGSFESTSSSASALATSSGAGNGTTAKYDPLSLLREIYLDSKVITLLSSPGGGGGSSSNSVQKFHPNGRYGRRSVDNFAYAPGAHTELAKLRFGGGAAEEDGGGSDALRSLLQLDNNPATWDELESTSSKQQDHLRWLLANNKKLLNNPRHRQQQQQQQQHQHQPQTNQTDNDKKNQLDSDSLASYRQEMNKLLKCNYSGVSNLFWCDS